MNKHQTPASDKHHGGPRAGAGRPSLAGTPGRSGTVNIRLTPEQRAKYDARGGAAWLRRLIDAA